MLFFASVSTNLVPEAQVVNDNALVYARDLDTGETKLVNVEPGLVPGKELTINQPSASDDGRYVAVAGGNVFTSQRSIHVFDRQTGTTEIASRANGAIA